MVIWLIAALLAAWIEATAVSRDVQKLEYFAKPAVIICLMIWLYASTDLHGNALWFELGLAFSLIGDIALLSPSNRMFLVGLFAFLITHGLYIFGLREELLHFSVWSMILLVLIYVAGLSLLRRMIAGIRARGQERLAAPVLIYGLVISFMLYAAASTTLHPAWETRAALFVGTGALLFWVSDLILAWNKFVSPVPYGRLLNIVGYHLGQIGMIAGVIRQLAQ